MNIFPRKLTYDQFAKQIIARYDTNKDGKLDVTSELTRYQGADVYGRCTTGFGADASWDDNKDGFLDTLELTKHYVKQLDTNHDGRIQDNGVIGDLFLRSTESTALDGQEQYYRSCPD